MDLLYIASIWGGAVTLPFLILMCIADLRTRSISDNVIGGYLAVLMVPVVVLYLNGLPYTYFLISLVMCGIWVLFRKAGAWGGGDTKFLMVFSLCCPLNPFNLYQQAFQLAFLFVLAGVMLVTAAFTGNRKDLPMMLPISAAIVITMLIGTFL